MLQHEPTPGAPLSSPRVIAAGDRPQQQAVSQSAWTRVRTNLFAQFWLKAVGTTAFMWLFFAAYFHLLRQPARAPLEMPLTVLDQSIGFYPWALWPYISLWVYVVVPPSLMPDARTLVRYGWWVGGLCVTGLACFYLWPTAVPPRVVSTVDLAGFDLLRGVDAAGNACPSMHVAAATFSALWIHRLVRVLALPAGLRLINAAWYGLIVWSTLAIKQHVWWDVVAGLALALAVTPASLRFNDIKRRADIIAPHWNRADGGK